MAKPVTVSARRKPPSCPSESEEGKNFVTWCDLHWWGDRLAHIPNGGKRNVREAARMKGEGVRKGWPDYLLAMARQGYHGLYIELKRQRGGSVSADQRDVHKMLRAEGYRVEVCKGFDAARAVVRDYLSMPRGTEAAKTTTES